MIINVMKCYFLVCNEKLGKGFVTQCVTDKCASLRAARVGVALPPHRFACTGLKIGASLRDFLDGVSHLETMRIH